MSNEYVERYHDFSIELDCPPGLPRPNDLIGGVLRDTGLKVDDFMTANPFFGHQAWVLKGGSPEKDELFKQHKQTTFKTRIVELYERGVIRYGTW